MGKIISLYGLPACGKTTQAEKLTKELGMAQFGMGERLRSEIESNSELGQKIKPFVEQGLLIPDDLMIEVIKNVGPQAKSDGVVFDGFPRMLSQAKMLEKISEEFETPFEAVFYLKIGAEELQKRIELRAEIGGREDDKDPKVIENRVNAFLKESVPLLDYYRNQGKLIEIDGEKEIDEIFAEIMKHLK